MSRRAYGVEDNRIFKEIHVYDQSNGFLVPCTLCLPMKESQMKIIYSWEYKKQTFCEESFRILIYENIEGSLIKVRQSIFLFLSFY